MVTRNKMHGRVRKSYHAIILVLYAVLALIMEALNKIWPSKWWLAVFILLFFFERLVSTIRWANLPSTNIIKASGGGRHVYTPQ